MSFQALLKEVPPLNTKCLATLSWNIISKQRLTHQSFSIAKGDIPVCSEICTSELYLVASGKLIQLIMLLFFDGLAQNDSNPFWGKFDVVLQAKGLLVSKFVQNEVDFLLRNLFFTDFFESLNN
jgi:hypothetical protein